MPAVHLDDTKDYFPDTKAFASEVLRLRKKYKHTIITPVGYLKNLVFRGTPLEPLVPECRTST